MTDTARDLLATAVEQPAGDLPDDAAIGTFEPWDSLAHVRLFAALETALGRQLTSDEAISIRSLGSLAAVLDGAD